VAEAAASLEERGLVGVVVGLLLTHRQSEGVQASGVNLLSHLSYCEPSRQQAAESGAFQAIATALRSHRGSKHVVQAAASTVLKLTYDSALRSIMAIDAGVHEALRGVLEGNLRLSEGGASKALSKGRGKPSGPPLWLRLCEASSRTLARFEDLKVEPQPATQTHQQASGLLW